jgi:orotidine-5'-phosphate decarboxylase
VSTTAVSVNARERLIFALDVASVEEARDLVRKLQGSVSFFKIGMELYVSSGPALIAEFKAQGKKVFLDLKFFDVPETVNRAVRRVAATGATFLTIHGETKIIQAAVEGRGDSDLKLLAVTALTSLDNNDLREMGFSGTVEDMVLNRAKTALERGCDGVIASPQEAGRVHELVSRSNKKNFLIVTPGVRPEGDASNDHKRLATPASAIEGGADYLVVGRPIRDAADPAKKAESIIAEMQQAFDRRAH